MGVFKRLEDVPEWYRLECYETAYRGRDVWQEFVVTRSTEFDSESYHGMTRRAGTAWKDHMDALNRDHALARPSDIETYVGALIEDRTPRTVYREYWIRVEQFYRWSPSTLHVPRLQSGTDGDGRIRYDPGNVTPESGPAKRGGGDRDGRQ